jgi:hypothetical protein
MKCQRRRSGKTRKKAPPKPNCKRKRQTPLPPRCPLHDVPMLVGHVSGARQYRYCTVRGCRHSISTWRQKKPRQLSPQSTTTSPSSPEEVGGRPGEDSKLNRPAEVSSPSHGGARGSLSFAMTLAFGESAFRIAKAVDFFPEYCI